MKSKHVLIIHTSVFVLFVLSSLSSPILAIYFRGFFSSWYFLASVAVVMIAVLGSWKLFGGCPFTVWENRLRYQEQLEQYLGSCLPHYGLKWFGLKISNRTFTWILVLLLLQPIAVGTLWKYAI